MDVLKVGVLVSGFGSNLQALIELCARPDVPAEIVSVVSNVEGVYALERAARAGIPAHAIPHRTFSNRAAFEAVVESRLHAAGAEFLCLAGFMRVLTPAFAERWRDRLLNIHPSLLPAFPGLDTHRRALAAGVRFHGCTVHFVRPALDNGPIVVQGLVPVLPADDDASLAARVHAAEQRAYPLALRLVAERRVKIIDERVSVDDGPQIALPILLNPPEAEEH